MTGHQVCSYGPPVTRNQPAHDSSPQYEIRVAGLLGPRWSAWFDGMTVATGDDGTTAIRGPVADQAALHGLLQKLRDTGMPLVSLTQIPSNDASKEQ
jgi:hypothetical protein